MDIYGKIYISSKAFHYVYYAIPHCIIESYCQRRMSPSRSLLTVLWVHSAAYDRALYAFTDTTSAGHTPEYH